MFGKGVVVVIITSVVNKKTKMSPNFMKSYGIDKPFKWAFIARKYRLIATFAVYKHWPLLLRFVSRKTKELLVTTFNGLLAGKALKKAFIRKTSLSIPGRLLNKKTEGTFAQEKRFANTYRNVLNLQIMELHTESERDHLPLHETCISILLFIQRSTEFENRLPRALIRLVTESNVRLAL